MPRLPLLIPLLVLFASPVLAQTPAPAPLSDARPPALEVIDDSVQPQVTIRKRGSDTVEEHRVNGKLYRVIVTPEHGAPYTLVDPKGDGAFVPDGPGSPQISVPMWVIGTF